MKARRSIRLKDYDCSQQGAYFVTICVYGRRCIFGDIHDAVMQRNEFGNLVLQTWHALPDHNSGIVLDAFVVMPNHVHGIVMIERAGLEPAPTALPEIIRQLKTFSSRKINQLRNTPQQPIWQRGYYEHVIRHQASLNNIREYIQQNPRIQMRSAIDE